MRISNRLKAQGWKLALEEGQQLASLGVGHEKQRTHQRNWLLLTEATEGAAEVLDRAREETAQGTLQSESGNREE